MVAYPKPRDPSSAEAELIALVKCSAELMGMRSAMRDWGVESNGVVYADSSAALAIANRKGAGKLRHIHISSLWIQEKQDLHQLEMRKVLGTENPADLMTKYLTRSVMDTHLEYLSQRRESGRAKSGLNIQGKSSSSAARLSTATGDQSSICLDDNWMNEASSHQVWPTLWLGSTQFEATDGSWKSVRHTAPRRALMTPKRVTSLKLPSGVEWTGRRRTVIQQTDRTTPTLNACTNSDDASDASDPNMPELTPLVVPIAQSAQAALERLNANHRGKVRATPREQSRTGTVTYPHARSKAGDQPTVFKDKGQGHKRRTQQWCESTLSP